MTKYRGFIFDQDGLLFDTEIVYQRAWIEAGRRLGFTIDPAFPKRFCGRGRREIAAFVREEFPSIDVETYLRTGEELAWSRQLASVPVPKRGLMEMLVFCRANGIRTAVASSSPRHVVEHNLTAAGIIDSFDAITTGDEVEHSKPAPDIFLLAASRIGIEPELCCVFEDAFSGVRGAVAAGMGAVLIPDQVEPTDEIRAICRVCPDLLAASERLRLISEFIPSRAAAVL